MFDVWKLLGGVFVLVIAYPAIPDAAYSLVALSVAFTVMVISFLLSDICCVTLFTTGFILSMFVTCIVVSDVLFCVFITFTLYVPFFVAVYVLWFVLAPLFHEYGVSVNPTILSIPVAVIITSFFVKLVVLALRLTSGYADINVIFTYPFPSLCPVCDIASVNLFVSI